MEHLLIRSPLCTGCKTTASCGLRVVVFLAGLIFLVGVGWLGAEQKEPQQSVDSGDQTYIKRFQFGLVPEANVTRELAWTPIHAVLESEDVGFEGYLEVYYPDQTEDRHRAAVNLPANGRKEIRLMVKHPWTFTQLYVALKRTNGEAVEQFRIGVGPRNREAQNVGMYVFPWSDVGPYISTRILVLDELSEGRPGDLLQKINGGAVSLPYDTVIPTNRVVASPYPDGLNYDRVSRLNLLTPRYSVPIPSMVGPVDDWGYPYRIRNNSWGISTRNQNNDSTYEYRGSLATPADFPSGRSYWMVPEYYHGAIEILGTGFRSHSADGVTQFSDHYFDARFFRGNVEYLPNHPFGYDAFDLVIIDGLDPNQINPAQAQALREWVELGGSILLCAGARPLWNNTWLADLSPVLPGESFEYQFRRRDFSLISPSLNSLFELKPLDGVICNVSQSDVRREATRVIAQHDLPMLARRNVGNGLVMYSAFSIKEAIDYGGFRRNCEGFLNYILPIHRAQPRANFHARNALEVMRVLNDSARTPRLNADLIFMLGIGFLVISVGANAWFWRRRNQMLYFWPTFVGICLVGSMGLWLLLRLSGFHQVTSNSYFWLNTDMGSELARGIGFSAMGSSYPQRVDYELEGTLGAPLYFHQSINTNFSTASFLGQRDEYESLNDTKEVLYPYWQRNDVREGEWQASLTDLVTGTGKTIHVNTEFAFNMEGAIECFHFEPESLSRRQRRPKQLWVRNTTPYHFHDVVLFRLMNHTQVVPDLAPGETARVDLVDSERSSLLKVMADMYPDHYNRLQELRDDRGDREKSTLSIFRLLLGIRQENQEFYGYHIDNLSDVETIEVYGLLTTEFILRYFLPSETPDFAMYLTGKLKGVPLNVETGSSNVIAKKDVMLTVRLPLRWISNSSEGVEDRMGDFSAELAAE